MNAFYAGAGGTVSMGTNTEYDGTDVSTLTLTNMSTAVTAVTGLLDKSSSPKGPPTTSAILQEVTKMIKNPVVNGYYPVYIDGKRGGAGYCAWHSWGSVNGVPVQFGFFFNLDSDRGCDPQAGLSTVTYQSQGIAAIGNLTGHELSEVVTDPRGAGWRDSSGYENSDKCAWTFNGVSTFSDVKTWKIQGNWSNSAYNNKSGYANGGCING